MSKMNITNIASEFSKVKLELEKRTTNNRRVEAGKLLVELVNKTPIDTGHARASWKVEETSVSINLINDAEYIQYLNEGSSKQAPSHFIESTALKYGVPVGTIVEIKGT